MHTRIRNLALAAALWVCAYGLGMLLGHGAKFALHGRGVLPNSDTPLSRTLPSPSYQEIADGTTGAVTAERSAFLSTPGITTLQYFEKQARALDVSANGEAFSHKLDELGPLLFLLSTNDYRKIWNWLNNMRSSDARACVRDRLLDIWSRREPRAAIDVVLALPDGEERSNLMRGLPANFGAAAPEAALAWVRQLPAGEQRDVFLTDMIGGIAERDVALATRLVDDLPPGSLRDRAVSRIVEHCLDDNPAAAAGLADKARNVFQQQGLFRYVAAAWAERNLPEALAWAQSLSTQSDRDNAMAGLVREMAQTQPDAAANLVLSQAEPGSRQLLARALAAGWAESDLPAAVDWVTRLPENVRVQGWEGLQQEWLLRAPEAAATFALQSLPAGETRNGALLALARTGAEAGWDEQAALQWVSRLPAGPERDAFLSGWCTQSIPGFGPRPEEAARLVPWMSTGDRRDETIEAIARHWLTIDSGAARKWLEATSLSPSRKARLLSRN